MVVVCFKLKRKNNVFKNIYKVLLENLGFDFRDGRLHTIYMYREGTIGYNTSVIKISDSQKPEKT